VKRRTLMRLPFRFFYCANAYRLSTIFYRNFACNYKRYFI